MPKQITIRMDAERTFEVPINMDPEDFIATQIDVFQSFPEWFLHPMRPAEIAWEGRETS